jgi:hypothetical protein
VHNLPHDVRRPARQAMLLEQSDGLSRQIVVRAIVVHGLEMPVRILQEHRKPMDLEPSEADLLCACLSRNY